MFVTSRNMQDGHGLLVRVVGVDIPNRLVHCKDKHNGTFIAAYKDTPVAHQIPQTGDIWSIVRRSGHWLMQNRIEQDDEIARTASLSPGDVHIKAPAAVKLNDGNLGYTTWEQFTMDGILTAVTLAVAPVYAKTVQAFDHTGLLILPNTYTLAGAVLTFGSPPSAGAVTVYYQRT